ncbi:hypothetical protein E2C01_077574 [Portunus trituberculatus]|uniref:Uncharacterized protein n=1 Tax=Portunus trituberculatus TaxID=210409 RepID=A0A5B7IMF9_PORTR|nr:hypothetical protein [Portunus trituberculatus]
MLLLLLLPLLSLSLLPDCVAGRLAPNTACNGGVCSFDLREDSQQTLQRPGLKNVSLAPATPTTASHEISLQQNSSPHHSGEDTPSVPLEVQEVREFSGLVLESIGAWLRRPSGEQGGQDAPTSLSQDLWWLRGLPRRSVVRETLEFLQESYLNAPSLEEMLTDLEEALRDLNDRLSVPRSPSNRAPHTNAFLRHRTKRDEDVTMQVVQVGLIIGTLVTSFIAIIVDELNPIITDIH